ncbi:MAG: ELMO domain-containing protein [Amphiamblys sp. WSBS2006]|nr:MAG: ELMO domain-containing protein [Amphiamblys sp. WSBS2006]
MFETALCLLASAVYAVLLRIVFFLDNLNSLSGGGVLSKLYKPAARLLTGKGEIERGLSRKKAVLVHSALVRSRQIRTKELRSGNKKEVLREIAKTKKIREHKKELGEIVDRISVFYDTKAGRERERKRPVDSEKEHGEELQTLWRKTMQTQAPKIPSEEWKRIGFQGTDPKTDFRGMGHQGLLDLVQLAEGCPAQTKKLVDMSQSAADEFPFSIVGVNVSFFVCTELERDLLRNHLLDRPVSVLDVYCSVFSDFSERWSRRKEKNLLHLGVVMKETKESFLSMLWRRRLLSVVGLG